MIINDEFMTTSSAMEFLGISRTTLINWDKSGKLVPMRTDRLQWKLYRIEDLKKFKEEREKNV